MWTATGLRTYYTLFVIDLATRRVHICGSTPFLGESFMHQVARNLTDAIEGFLLRHRVLICDRDAKFTEQFRRLLDKAGVTVVLTPFRAPNCNAIAERFVRSIKEECLDRMIVFGESSLRRAIAEFVAHYHRERPHQGIGNVIIDSAEPARPGRTAPGELVAHERLGGLLRHYSRAA